MLGERQRGACAIVFLRLDISIGLIRVGLGIEIGEYWWQEWSRVGVGLE